MMWMMRRLPALAVALAAIAAAQPARADILLVSDVTTGSILKYDSTNPTAAPVAVFHDGQLNTPFGMVFDGQSNLYVDSLGTGQIYKYTPAQLAAGGNQTGTAFLNLGTGSGPVYPNDMVFLPNGHLLVSSYATGSVIEYDAGGAKVGVYASGLTGPTGLAYDPTSGKLYISNSLSNQIVVVSAAGGTPVPLTLPPIDHPAAITIANGILYATGFADDHPASSSVLSYNLTTNAVQQKFASSLVNPAGIAVAGDGSLYVTGYNSGQIFHLGTDLGIIGSYTPSGTPDVLSYIVTAPSGLTFGSVPEPSSLALAGIGLALIFGLSRRRRIAKAA